MVWNGVGVCSNLSTGCFVLFVKFGLVLGQNVPICISAHSERVKRAGWDGHTVGRKRLKVYAPTV